MSVLVWAKRILEEQDGPDFVEVLALTLREAYLTGQKQALSEARKVLKKKEGRLK